MDSTEIVEHKPPYQKKWEEMDVAILAKIFRKFPTDELSGNICNVCTSWERICWQILFWDRKICDLRSLPLRFFGEFGLDAEKNERRNKRLLEVLESLTEGRDVYGKCLTTWTISLEKVIIPYNLPLANSHIIYIAITTEFVEELDLFLENTSICPNAIASAMSYWTSVKRVNLGGIQCAFFNKLIRQIGKYCENIETLRLESDDLVLERDNALALATALSGVKKLAFKDVHIFKAAYNVIIKKCRELEEIEFDHCHFMNQTMGAMYVPPRVTFFLKIGMDQDKGTRKFEVDAEIGNSHPSLRKNFLAWIMILLVGLEIFDANLDLLASLCWKLELATIVGGDLIMDLDVDSDEDF